VVVDPHKYGTPNTVPYPLDPINILMGFFSFGLRQFNWKNQFLITTTL